eukprot:364703-Chlamydomonas_euryale.AAC.3
MCTAAARLAPAKATASKRVGRCRALSTEGAPSGRPYALPGADSAPPSARGIGGWCGVGACLSHIYDTPAMTVLPF